jgi:CheY-like chemotaxis protein
VTVYSELGHGSIFRLYLPPSPVLERGPAAPAPVHVRPDRGGREIILVVDDNDAMREVAALQLHGLGYEVIVAENPSHALDVLKSPQNVDLLLTDIVMPGDIDGRELAVRAREIRPDLNLLFTSGFAESALADSIRTDFSAAILSKPYRRADLAQRLRGMFEKVAQA